MMSWDSSALVPLVITESATVAVREMLHADETLVVCPRPSTLCA
jgi:predicted nucleic acid-binding protein